MDLVNEVTIAGDDAHLCYQGAEKDDNIFWKRLIFVNNDATLGTWHPIRGALTFGVKYFFAANWSDTLYIKGAVETDTGIYSCNTDKGPESFGQLTILSTYAMYVYRAFRCNT